MKRFACLLFLLNLSAACLAETNPPSPFAVSHLFNAEGDITEHPDVFQAEPVRLAVDIYSPTWFAKAPSIENFSVAGALLLRTEKFATNFTQRRGGHSYTVQRWEYTLYPQRSGRFVIPSTEVRVQIAQPGSSEPQAHRLRSNPLLFQVQPLPDSPDIPPNSTHRVLSASQVHIEQRIIKADRQLLPGDAIQRRVTIRAEDAMGMLIPALTWPNLPGARQQSEPPRVEDNHHRGDTTGTRVETRSYTFTGPGQYTLPELHFQWWDSDLKQWQSRSLPGDTLMIEASPTAKPVLRHSLSRTIDDLAHRFMQLSQIQRWTIAGGLLLLIVSIAMANRWRAWWKEALDSEFGRYLKMRHSIKHHHARQIRYRFYDWRQSNGGCPKPTTPELDALLAELYGMPDSEKPSPQLRSRLLSSIEQMRQPSSLIKVRESHLNPWTNGPKP